MKIFYIHNIYFQDSKLYAEKDRYNNGLAMYTFYDCNLQPKSYRVYDLDQSGRTENEQATVQEMIDALDGTFNVLSFSSFTS